MFAFNESADDVLRDLLDGALLTFNLPPQDLVIDCDTASVIHYDFERN